MTTKKELEAQYNLLQKVYSDMIATGKLTEEIKNVLDNHVKNVCKEMSKTVK